MSPSLYDLLDVDEAASADEIRAKWKAAIADFDPGDRRFRAYNDAAAVLLDEDKRASYDAELASARAEETAADEAVGDSVEEATAEEPTPGTVPEPVVPASAAAADDMPALVEPRETISDEDRATSEATVVAERSGPPLWSLVLAGIGALLAVALAAWTLALPDAKPRAVAAATLATEDSQVEQLVADKVVPAMSYDYRTLASDLAGLQKYMTPAMAQQQAQAWKKLTPTARQEHAIVVSHVPNDAPGTGLTLLSDDGTRAVVVAFIDQDVRRLATSPFSLTMWATFVLDKDPSSGAWLVDKVCTDRVCS